MICKSTSYVTQVALNERQTLAKTRLTQHSKKAQNTWLVLSNSLLNYFCNKIMVTCFRGNGKIHPKQRYVYLEELTSTQYVYIWLDVCCLLCVLRCSYWRTIFWPQCNMYFIPPHLTTKEKICTLFTSLSDNEIMSTIPQFQAPPGVWGCPLRVFTTVNYCSM